MRFEIVNKVTLLDFASKQSLLGSILQFLTEKKLPVDEVSQAYLQASPAMIAEFLVVVEETLSIGEDDSQILLVTLPEILGGKVIELNHTKVGLLSLFLWVNRDDWETYNSDGQGILKI